MRASDRQPATAVDAVEPVILVDDAPHTTHDAEFTAFVRAHQADLLRTAWLLVGDAHRAEELTQNALVRTYGAWRRVRDGDPLAYARRVLVNLRTDSWRRRRRELLVEPDRLAHEVRPGRADDDRLADRDLVVRALSTLTRRQRTVLVLRHFLGLPEAEVADELGVSVGTVKATTARAIAKLRAELVAEPSAAAAPPSRTRTGDTP
ncbi:MAG: SigE family RNA polymerase sigma factor [Actinomycetales bacterium]|nr:SigE family RNA polymerase sigma factor [Actinomycetales bacterium]